MFKTFCTYLTICSLVTSQLAALPPGTGETEPANTSASAVSSCSTSTSTPTPQSAAALEEGRQHKDNPNPTESIKPELKALTTAVTAVKSSLSSIDSELTEVKRNMTLDQTSVIKGVSLISSHLEAQSKVMAEDLPKIATILNNHTLAMNEDLKVHSGIRLNTRVLNDNYVKLQYVTLCIMFIGMVVFCVYVSRMADDLHSIAGDIHRLADNSQSANLISRNSTANLQSLLEIFAKRP